MLLVGKTKEKWMPKWGGAYLQRPRIAKAILMQLMLWTQIWCRAQIWGKDRKPYSVHRPIGSHEPGTRQLQCNPKRSYWILKERISLAESVDSSGNISRKWQVQQRQEEYPASCTGTQIIHVLKASVSCCLHVWTKLRGRESDHTWSYMSCLLCLRNMKQATLKQTWSKCGCFFMAQINYGLAEKPRHAQEEESLGCSHRITSSVIDARHLAWQLLSWICELGVGQSL